MQESHNLQNAWLQQITNFLCIGSHSLCLG